MSESDPTIPIVAENNELVIFGGTMKAYQFDAHLGGFDWNGVLGC